MYNITENKDQNKKQQDTGEEIMTNNTNSENQKKQSTQESIMSNITEKTEKEVQEKREEAISGVVKNFKAFMEFNYEDYDYRYDSPIEFSIILTVDSDGVMTSERRGYIAHNEYLLNAAIKDNDQEKVEKYSRRLEALLGSQKIFEILENAMKEGA